MNKIIVSIVLTITLIFGINKITDVLYNVEKLEKSAYQVASITEAETNTDENSKSLDSGNIMSIFA